jgi:hypothetical protein
MAVSVRLQTGDAFRPAEIPQPVHIPDMQPASHAFFDMSYTTEILESRSVMQDNTISVIAVSCCDRRQLQCTPVFLRAVHTIFDAEVINGGASSKGL